MNGLSHHDILGIGFGPSNLALATALEGLNRRRRTPLRATFLERQESFVWRGDMLLPGTDMQIAFIKDLVTLRDPTSQFSFLNYLHEKGRLNAFLNLKTFNPSRVEFNDYLSWAADKLAAQVCYGETVDRIEPLMRDGRIVALEVASHQSDGQRRRRTAHHLVVAIGGRPRIPAPFDVVADRRVLHSSRYLSGVGTALADVAKPRIAVIGGGQSGAEIAVDAGERFPAASVDLIIRGHALRPSDDSAFANEDLVYGLERDQRVGVLSESRHTNYAVVDATLIARLHAIIYDERVRGFTRRRLLRDTDVVAVAALDQAVALRLHDRLQGRFDEARYDAVIVATGYDRSGLPDLIEPLRPHLQREAINRNYRLPLLSSDATLHLQGWSEATHGVSDTLLSVTSVRAGEIAASIEASETSLMLSTQAVCA